MTVAVGGVGGIGASVDSVAARIIAALIVEVEGGGRAVVTGVDPEESTENREPDLGVPFSIPAVSAESVLCCC